jgi:hypothetical protein
MVDYCCPVDDFIQEECLCITEEDWFKLQLQLSTLQSMIQSLQINGQGNPADLMGMYMDLMLSILKMMNAAADTTDKNTTIASTTALQSMVMFNNNYKLLKGAFENLQNLINNLSIDGTLKYRLVDVSSDTTIGSTDMTGNPIYRLVDSVVLTVSDIPSDQKGKVIHVRSCIDEMVKVEGNIKPEDATYLRREGNTLGLIWTGTQWDAYGELP